MITRMLALSLVFAASIALAETETRRIEVFVALCDNESQGIQKVPAAIGDGDDPDGNLYWGCSDGLRSFFKNSRRWTLESTEENPDETVLERLEFTHNDFQNVRLVARAYRGSEIRRCMEGYLAALADRDDPPDLVAFIGHNGLMDFRLPEPDKAPASNGPDTIVLCCLSESYFTNRLTKLRARPLLLTHQLMYPGAFLLHDALEGWLRGETRPQIRDRAGRAYAKNQGISVNAGRGIFAELK